MHGYQSMGYGSAGRSGDEHSDGDGGGSPGSSSRGLLSGAANSLSGSPSGGAGGANGGLARFHQARASMHGGSSSLARIGTTRTSLRRTRSIVVLGASMVGKTAVCVRCVSERFEEAYEATYENSFVKPFIHRGQEVELLIKDTQGVGEQEMFRAEYGLGVHGYILVYSVTSARSFELVQSINRKLLHLMGTHQVPRVLVGNKLDVALQNPALRQVSTEAGAALAREWGCAFLECSAKGDVNCDQAFHALLDEIDECNEPDGGHARDGCWARCWRSRIGCFLRACCSCRRRSVRNDEEEPLSPSSPLEPLPASAARAVLVAKSLVWTVLALGVVGVVTALLLGLDAAQPILGASAAQQDLLCYVLFGFALLLWLLGVLGVYALRASRPDLLHAYALSLGVHLAAQVVAAVLLCAHIPALEANWPTLLLLLAIPLWSVQAVAAWTGLRLAAQINRLDAGFGLASPESPAFQTTYRSLYA